MAKNTELTICTSREDAVDMAKARCLMHAMTDRNNPELQPSENDYVIMDDGYHKHQKHGWLNIVIVNLFLDDDFYTSTIAIQKEKPVKQIGPQVPYKSKYCVSIVVINPEKKIYDKVYISNLPFPGHMFIWKDKFYQVKQYEFYEQSHTKGQDIVIQLIDLTSNIEIVKGELSKA